MELDLVDVLKELKKCRVGISLSISHLDCREAAGVCGFDTAGVRLSLTDFDQDMRLSVFMTFCQFQEGFFWGNLPGSLSLRCFQPVAEIFTYIDRHSLFHLF